MKTIKKFLFGLLLNKTQKRIIWEAVQYSHETYLRRHNIEQREAVAAVIAETRDLFLSTEKKDA